jgi:phosphoribosylanthranilate isomerase
MSLTSAASELQTTRRVKICGVTQRDQALAIADLGADFIGINFWPQSKRYLPLDKAVTWMRELPPATQVVGVFVNPDPAYLDEAASSGCLARLQLHGDESSDFCMPLVARGLQIIKAFQVREEASLDVIADYPVSDILLDAYHPNERGGIGESFPWSLALAFKRKFANRSLWLAGGLTPDNVADAVRSVRPYAVDVASGVEASTPGVKDLQRVEQFIRRAKEGAPLV